MNLLGVEVWIIVGLVFQVVICQQWDTAYSPLYPDAFLKLSNNEILQISNNQSYNYGDSITNIIPPPTSQNYSITVANGDLYAFYKGSVKSNYSISISLFNVNSSKWEGIQYNTTLSKNSNYQYFEESTVMSSPDEDNYDSIYIYGGRSNNTISNRILQFNPYTKTLNSIITSVSPTGFYGSANAIIDSKGTSNLLIGGKASSGWVSMFQIALWEYKSWTFKTVSSSSLSINSRINPLVLSIFKGDDSDASSVLVLGGVLGNKLASPYVLNLNLTDDWKWQDWTKSTDLNVNNILGAVAFNSTLFTVQHKNNKKRGNEYTLNLFSVDTLLKVDKFDSSYQDSQSSKGEESSSSSQDSSSESSSLSSALSASSSSISSEVFQSSSSSQISSSSLLSVSSPTGNVTTKHSNAQVIVPAVVVPIIGAALISILCFFFYKKYFQNDDTDSISDSDSDLQPDIYKEVNQIDNQSISSWNQKRDEYERRRYSQQRSPIKTATTPTSKTTPTHSQQRSPTRQSTDFTFDNTNNIAKKIIKFSHHSKPSLQQHRSHWPFANPEDYADKQELSPTSNRANRSRVSLISSKGDTASSRSDEVLQSHDDEEEHQIDEFLGNRDVQVLVSSRRRSKLRITNPDIESLASISEAGSGSTIYDEKLSSGSQDDSHSRLSYSRTDVFADENGVENDEYFREILKAFDNDDLSTDIGSFDKYDHE